MSVRILIADDHEVIRQGIRMILQARPQWEICAEATNGHDTIRIIRELKPDVSIVDITMPGLSGLEATQQITRHSDSKILIFTMHESASLADSVRKVGARGYVSKSHASRQLIQAIECILDGGTFFGEPRKAAKEPGGSGPDPILLCSALAWLERRAIPVSKGMCVSQIPDRALVFASLRFAVLIICQSAR